MRSALANPSHGTKRRVLIIEDNRDSADSLKLLLDLLGHETRVAYDGETGIEQADEWRPDVVLCDIGLPGLDGYQVAAELVRRSVRSTALLVAVTAYTDDESRARSFEAGFHHHVSKPADLKVLLPLVAG
jgi:CheY-like chemotaxis protein